jgi:hypothetical protein
VTSRSFAAASQPRHAWQFDVAHYGARGDGRVIYDAAITTGTNTLTSATAGFTTADVGKAIMVNNAGPAPDRNHSGALITTIAGYTDASTVTLTDDASRTVSGQSAVYGTDDTTAIQAAMAALAASDGFTSTPRYAELVFDPKIYILATPPTPGGDPDQLTYGNAQIPLPIQPTTDVKPVVVIRSSGVDNSTLDFWQQTRPQTNGTTLLSMIEVTASDATYGPVSVIGGPTVAIPPNSGYNNVQVVIDGIQITCPVNPGQIGIDLYRMAQFAIKTASIDVFGSPAGDPTIQFAGASSRNTRGQGLRVNWTGLNDRCDIGSLSIEGYYYGMSLDEHCSVERVAIIYCVIGIYMSTPGGGQLHHACRIGYASVEICDYCLYNDGSAGSLFGVVIDALDNEGDVVAHIYDPANALSGRVNLLPSGSQSLPDPPIVNGAGNLEILTFGQTRGAVTAPTVPASTVALQNPFWRHAAVTITGGTVTDISVDGASTGVTSGTVIVPSGKTITVAYSSAPTWVWTIL